MARVPTIGTFSAIVASHGAPQDWHALGALQTNPAGDESLVAA
jgi:hypothetical protein